MNTKEGIIFIVLFLISLGCFILSYFNLKERGFLFNNAYIYASKKERESMNKKPYYRQSGVVFVLVGVIFLINAIEIMIHSGWLFYLSIAIAILVILYAIASSILIESKNN